MKYILWLLNHNNCHRIEDVKNDKSAATVVSEGGDAATTVVVIPGEKQVGDGQKRCRVLARRFFGNYKVCRVSEELTAESITGHLVLAWASIEATVFL